MSGTPYLAGSNQAASGGSTELDVSITTSVNAFDSIFVGVLVSSAGVIPTVADSAGNTYTQILSDTVETGAQLFVFESDGSNALVAGTDIVQVFYSTTASVQGAIVVGDNNATGADKIFIAHGSSAAPSSGSSGTLTQAEEHGIAFICDTNAGGVPTWAAPWSSNVLTNINASSTTRLSAAYQTVTATTALTASGTITSAPWTTAIITSFVADVTVLTTMSDGVATEAYSQTLEASGGVGAYTWTVSSGTLPTGVTLSAGVVSGTPTVAGTYSFTITATDAHSVAGSLAQTVVIAPSAAGGAAAITLPGNNLVAGDADFETATGLTWAADTNAGTPARTTAISLTGTTSLGWASLADGDTQISTGFYAVVPSQSYVASGYILPCGQRDTQIGIEWYDNTHTIIETDLGTDNPSDSISWQPVTAALTSPSNAAFAKVVAVVQESNKGDVNHIDLCFLSESDAQILIDWENSTFAPGGNAGQDFMDCTPFVRLDQSITINRGRQDSISEMEPGNATLVLQNDSGIFTRYKSTSIAAVLGGEIDLQRRVQINLADENGLWYTRFDGPISEVDYVFDNTGFTSLCTISVSDVLSFLSREDDLACWTKEQVLNDNPWLHWTLNDSGNAGGSGVCAESSGNNGPAMRLLNSDNTTGANKATIAFQDTTGGVETLADASMAGNPDGSEFWSPGTNQPNTPIRGLDSGTVGPYTAPLGSVYLTPKLTAQTGVNYFTGNAGYQLQAALPETIAPWQTGTDYTFECWFTVDPTVLADKASKFGPYTIMSLGTARQGTCLVAGIYLTGGTPYTFTVGTYNQPPAFLGKNFPGTAPPALVSSITQSLAADTVQIPHHLVVTISGDPTAPMVTAWLDGTQFGSTFTLPKHQYYDTFCVGGAYGGLGCHFGNVTLASIYQYAMSSTQVALHCQLGQYGMWETTTDDCVAQLAQYAAMPSFWDNVAGKHNGLTLTEYQDITGTNALANMQLFEQAEGGLLFVDATGALNFHTRDWRMGYGSPDLNLPPDTYDADMGYELVDQFMQNENAIASQTYQTGSAFVNTQSQEQYGVYATSPVDSPLQLPLITFNRAYSQLGLTSFDFFSDPNLDDLAAWNANSHAQPYLAPGLLTIDLLTLSSTSTGLAISDFYSLEIDNMLAPIGTLPASFPDKQLSQEWFIEGISETITDDSRNIQFYTSPAETQRAWVPGDPVYGVLGTTSRIGISAADISTPQADGKDVSHDGGRPYWPPNFSTNMNNPSSNGHSFIGGLDIRGLTDNLNLLLNPPMCVVGAVSQTQSVSSGVQTSPQIFWDTIYIDTVGGMGAIPGWPNWYVCLVPGFYDIDANLVWARSSSGDSNTTSEGWIVVAQQGAQTIATGGTPLAAVDYVCPIGESSNRNTSSMNVIEAPSTRMYLGLGDMVTLAAAQDVGSSRGTGTNYNGSSMALRWAGYSTVDDRVQLNSSINGGGAPVQKQTTKTFTKTYKNTHTYSYYGAAISFNRKNQDSSCYQGTYSGGSGVTGSESSQVVFNHGAINADLTVAGTVKIKSVTLECNNNHFWYDSGGKLMLGYSTQTPGGSTFDAHSVSNRDIFEESFNEGQEKTFTLPSAFATTFQGSGKCFIVGDSRTTNLDYYGYWQGGPNSWTLTITYTVTS